VRIADLAIAPEYAELVALRIGEGHPTGAVRSAVIGELDGTETKQSPDFLFAGRISRSKIEVKPILDLFAFRYLDEQQSSAAAGGKDHALLVARLVRILRILAHAEHLCPPHRLLVGVPRVDGGVADPRCHTSHYVGDGPWQFDTCPRIVAGNYSATT
jgi:hypothetical protein